MVLLSAPNIRCVTFSSQPSEHMRMLRICCAALQAAAIVVGAAAAHAVEFSSTQASFASMRCDVVNSTLSCCLSRLCQTTILHLSDRQGLDRYGHWQLLTALMSNLVGCVCSGSSAMLAVGLALPPTQPDATMPVAAPCITGTAHHLMTGPARP